MKALLIAVLLPLCLYAQDLILKKSYEFEGDTFYAQDFFPQLKKNFAVIHIPNHLTHFNLAQQRIFDLFAREGITLYGEPNGLVHFQRKLSLDLNPLKEKIRSYYLEKLPFLTIKNIIVTSKVNIDRLPKEFDLHLKRQAYKNYKGTVKITTEERRLFFKYEVDASYSSFVAKKTMRKGTLLTVSNTKMSIKKFRSYHSDVIGYEQLGKVRTRSYIKAGKSIRKRDVEPLPLVKKGSIVNVKVIEGNIIINFTATAQQDGALGELITIKRSDGTRRRAKVVGKRMVELQ